MSDGAEQLSCAEVEDLAAELALNVLPGDQRALVLAHLGGCPDCRQMVDELAEAADALSLAIPRVAPPADFAGKVLRGMQPGRPTRRRPRRQTRRWRLAGAAVAAAALAVTVVSVASPGSGGLPSSLSQAALASPSVQTARLTSTGSDRLDGVVLVHASPSWLFMTVTDDDGAGGTYVCEVDLADGQTLRAGSFAVHDGTGAWGQTLPRLTAALRTVRVLGPDGSVVATASFG